ncbi:MAG: DNA mismatch repair endonuclease MutL [Bacteroidota bacterium]
MSDIIQLLPDSVANQIAAGEVIQRPASAVKELLENAIDAGSTQIDVHIKESGKTLIQVIDNGCGMSAADARMAFERHATSKIRAAQDLFSIRTMGFRGEALASIAAVAQVELKTRRHDEEVGTEVLIEGSQVKSQEPVSTAVGTAFSIKNLFYNIPARRNFLKSNPVEARHIIDEFERVALAHPEVGLSLQQNGVEIFRLPAGNHRQRIVGIYGSLYNERLVPVAEETSLVKLSGFVGKPEFAKKSRGEQFFFVNRRFIKDPYLHHAVVNAFSELLPSDSYPSYWIHIEIDPSKIDVNIHPTKTEIKFEDERSVYAIVRAAVKRSLGQYAVSPTLDFERETSFDVPVSDMNRPVGKPGVMINTGFNPFNSERRQSVSVSGWERLYEGLNDTTLTPETRQASTLPLEPVQENEKRDTTHCFQLSDQTIVCDFGGNSLLFIDPVSAHQRILFEQFLSTQDHAVVCQHELFPSNLTFTAQDATVLRELLPTLRDAGFDIQEFSGNTFVLQGSPVAIEKGTEHAILESIIEEYKHSQQAGTVALKEKTARAMAKSLALRQARRLDRTEMLNIFQSLMGCQEPSMGIDGRPCSWVLTHDEIVNRMKRTNL